MDTGSYVPIPGSVEGKQCLNVATHAVTLGEFARFVKERAYKTALEEMGNDYETWLNSDWTGGRITLEQAAGEWSQGPVVYLTRHDAEAYCDWFGEGRLPSVAELAAALVEAQATGVSFEVFGYELVNHPAGPWGGCVYSNATTTCFKLVRDGASACELRKCGTPSVQDDHILPDRTITREGLTAILRDVFSDMELDTQPAGFRIVR
jgi:hypothetical protein